MLDELSSLVKPEYRFSHMKDLLNILREVLDMADTHYLLDKSTRNKALDCICDIIDSQKSTPKEMQ